MLLLSLVLRFRVLKVLQVFSNGILPLDDVGRCLCFGTYRCSQRAVASSSASCGVCVCVCVRACVCKCVCVSVCV